MTKKKKATILAIWTAIAAIILAGTIFLTWYATTWDRALSGYFGYIGEEEVTSEELTAAQEECALEIVDEGGVLLKNDNDALPLATGSKVSVFGQTAQMWITRNDVTNTKDTVFLESLESAGLEVNPELRKFYKQSKHTNWGTGANAGDGGIAGTWEIDEVPQSEYTSDVKSSYASYSDAAIVVFSRSGSEGGDLPRYMGRYGGSDDESYLELNQDEKDLLAAIQNAGVFKKTIVVLHTGNAMQMDFADVEAYGIDAIIWIAGTGQDGVEELGKYFTGEVNPSGKNVDTYVTDNFSSSAMQNFGDYRFTSDGDLIEATTSTVGGTYSYINYGESIYMGYKYYETRYEDAVMNTANVGDYDYASTVYAPFGYGLSYTDFTWTDFTCSEPDKNGDMEVSVTVKNTGDVAGKDVVQLYYQSPYTDYDKQYGVEKAAVNLIDFEKTSLLQPGKEETVSFTVNIEDMVSYDSNGAKTYILDAGDYYLTAATDAHAAVNNILAAKGYTTADGMTAEGDTAFVHQHTESERTEYPTSSTGYTVTNQFDDATLDDATYLSRSNWQVLDSWSKDTWLGGVAYATSTRALGTSGTTAYSATTDEEGTVGIHEASDEVYEGLTSGGWDTSGNPVSMTDASWASVSYSSTSTSYVLTDMIGVDYDDEKWDDLVNQTSQAEQLDLVGRAGWGTSAVDSVGKPETHYLDGPQGMIDYISGGQGYQFTDAVVVGATWNKELAAREGDLCSQEFVLKGASMWWAPAMNLHRTPFSGRNFEYFSEDGIHSGLMAVEMVKAAQDNGVVTQIKHFFLNDQETNRGANGRVATFATEQSMRETYLKPFQICVEEGNAHGVMSTMCRIGTKLMPCSYQVNTEVLRNEWGMKGTVITDAQSLTEEEAEAALAAGCDMVCTTSQTSYLSSTLDSAGGQYMLHQAVKNILYITVNSIAISSDYSSGFPVYILMLIGLNVFVVVYLLYGTAEILMKLNPEQTVLKKKGKWILRGIMWGIAAIVIVTVLVMFFTTWLADLTFALQTI